MFNEEKLFGFRRAIVTENNDPKKAGRIRVKVMPEFVGVKDERCPWATMADPSMGGLSNRGGSNIPEKGAHVWVFFENGDHRFPVYFAGAPAMTEEAGADLPKLSRESTSDVDDINRRRMTGVEMAEGGTWDEPESAYQASYPHNHVFRSKAGIVIEMDDTPEGVRLHVLHPSGSRSEIDNDGNKVDHIQGDSTLVVVGAKKVSIDTTLDLNVKSAVRIKTPVLVLDGNLKVTGDMLIGGSTHSVGTVTCENDVLAEKEVAAMSKSGKVRVSKHIHPTKVGPSDPPIPNT